MKVKYKNKKVIFQLTDALAKDYGIRPGMLFKLTAQYQFINLPAPADKDGVVWQFEVFRSHTLASRGDYLLFLDIVYEAKSRIYFVRFLRNENIVGMSYLKGRTFKRLKDLLCPVSV